MKLKRTLIGILTFVLMIGTLAVLPASQASAAGRIVGKDVDYEALTKCSSMPESEAENKEKGNRRCISVWHSCYRLQP